MRLRPNTAQIGNYPVSPVGSSLGSRAFKRPRQRFSGFIQPLLWQRSDCCCQFAAREDVFRFQRSERQQRGIPGRGSTKLRVVICGIQKCRLDHFHQRSMEPWRPEESLPCRSCLHSGRSPVEERQHVSRRPAGVHPKQRDDLRREQDTAMTEFADLCVADSGKPGDQIGRQSLIVFQSSPEPPFKQSLDYLPDRVVDGATHRVIGFAFLLVIKRKHSVAKREESALLAFEGSGDLSQPEADAVAERLQSLFRRPVQQSRHGIP